MQILTKNSKHEKYVSLWWLQNVHFLVFPGNATSGKNASEDEPKLNQPSTSKDEEKNTDIQSSDNDELSNRPTVILRSQKMKQLKDLLLSEKLNTHAISLHLTAQSQVQVGKKGRLDNGDNVSRVKRTRRE